MSWPSSYKARARSRSPSTTLLGVNVEVGVVPLAPSTPSSAVPSAVPDALKYDQLHRRFDMFPSGSESVAVMAVPTSGVVEDSDTVPASSTLVTDTDTATLADSDPSETSTVTA